MKKYLWIIGLARPIDKGVPSTEIAVVAASVEEAVKDASRELERNLNNRYFGYAIVGVVHDREVVG